MVRKSLIFVFAFAFVLLLQIQTSFAAVKFPQSVINEMATRKMRYHHFLWHQVRENWNQFTSSVQNQFADLGWAPPNPARTFDSAGNSYAVTDNYSGEDFLYMHRQMIQTANDIIEKNDEPYGKITGWDTIPPNGDKTYPVPFQYTIPGRASTTEYMNTRKTSTYYKNTIVPQENYFKSASNLRRLTLAELGSRIEVTIHSWLHLRFSRKSDYGYRGGYRGTIPNVDKKWDDVQYNWLGDSYASHVNPLFWKIHGWVDDRIEDWRKANGLSSIRWKGTWTGGPMENLSSVLKKQGGLRTGNSVASMEDGDDGDTMEKVLQVFLKSGVPETSFADDVRLPPLPGKGGKMKTRRLCKSRKGLRRV